jgi:hypothetical protein
VYSIVMSRTMTLRIPEWYKLEDFNKKVNKSKAEQLNIKLMNEIAKDTGVPIILLYVDACNHYQPKYGDQRDRRNIFLDTKPGYFISGVNVEYFPGDEVGYTYFNEPTNALLYLHYGFIIRENKYNHIFMPYEKEDYLNQAQVKLCKDLGCVGLDRKTKLFKARLHAVDESALNYARVKYLIDDFDNREIFKKLVNNEIISYDNEMNAWGLYYQVARKMIRETDLSRSIRKAQKFTNICKGLLAGTEEHTMNKHFELIYRLDISYKLILHKQVKAAVNQIILNTANELDFLKNKYLNN